MTIRSHRRCDRRTPFPALGVEESVDAKIPAAPAVEAAQPDQPPDADESPRRGRVPIWRSLVTNWALLAMLVVEIIVFAIVLPSTFWTTSNFENILSSQAVFLIVTLGLTIPVLAGEFDVSVASNLGFSMVLMGYLSVLKHWPFGLALITCIVAGTVIGGVNAFLVVRLGMNSFIATIGTGTVLTGLATYLSNSAVIPGLPQALVRASTAQLFSIPLPVYYGFGLAFVLWLIYEHTPLGRRLLFVGAGRDAARLAGVRVQRLRSGALIASGTIAAVAGLVLAGELGASDPTAGPSYLLPAFAGVFLGATTIKPGRANAWGTVIALYVLTVGVTGLQLLGAGSWVQDVFNGSALILGIALTRLAARGGLTQSAW